MKDKEYGLVKIDVDGNIEVLRGNNINVELSVLHDVVQGYIEIVNCELLPETEIDVKMVVNENGKNMGLKQNAIATALYGNPFDCIVGNVVLGTTYNPDPLADPDLYALSADNAEFLAEFIEDMKQDLILNGIRI